jgi:hypothetical protein
MNNHTKYPLPFWWLIWAAFQIGIFIIYFFLGRTDVKPQSFATHFSAWLAGFAPVALSVIVRWLILPRTNNAQIGFSLFIIGIALAEMTCFLGLFVFPTQKQELFILSALGIFQFIPLFARRYITHDEQNRNA